MQEGLFRWLFGRSACNTCDAHLETVVVLRENNVWLRERVCELESALLRATRLSVNTSGGSQHTPRPDGFSTMPQSWNKVRQKLEKRHSNRDKSPEDLKEREWTEKIAKMEQETGIADKIS